MANTYLYMEHVNFRNAIGLSWFGPVTGGQRYAEVCNMALKRGMAVVAILDDGVVYKKTT